MIKKFFKLARPWLQKRRWLVLIIACLLLVSSIVSYAWFTAQSNLDPNKTSEQQGQTVISTSSSKFKQIQDQAKTALAKLLRSQPTNLSSNLEQSGCREEESLEQAKACTYVILTDRGHGSAFAIDEYYLVTNKHVIENANQIETWFNNEEKIKLILWNFAQNSDIAVLKSFKPLNNCNWADSSNLQLAETLYTVGWPNSAEGESSITKGIFSRFVQTAQGPTFIQTDAAINPGNSGGPLVGRCGIVGINTAKIAWSENNVPAEGFSFAITSQYAQPVVEELIAGGQEHALPITDLGEVEYSFVKRPPSEQPSEQKIVLTEESKQSWVEAREATYDMQAYWFNQTDNLDQTKLEQLKDLIARMKMVVDLVVPKIEDDQPLTQAEQDLLQAWRDMYPRAIKLEEELHKRDYSQGYAHFECRANSCALVSGRGFDKCSSAQDCAPKYHYECQDLSCTVVEGEGEDECNSHDDCYYYMCEDQVCIKKPGEGTDQCYFDWQCVE
jgi:S1-C subfamily serine protease